MMRQVVSGNKPGKYRFKYGIGDIISGISPKGVHETHLIIDLETTKIHTISDVPVYRTLRLDNGRVNQYGRKYIDNMEMIA